MQMVDRRWWGLVAGCALLAATAMAQAQYVWIDERGLKHYSDRPPAPSVPRNRMLKEPGPAQGVLQAAPKVQAATDQATIAQRDMDFLKRKTETAAAQQKAAQETQRQRELADHCDANRKNLQMLESNAPVGIIGKDGERAFLDDEARARQTRKARDALTQCK
jgi:hypothetical protein